MFSFKRQLLLVSIDALTLIAAATFLYYWGDKQSLLINISWIVGMITVFYAIGKYEHNYTSIQRQFVKSIIGSLILMLLLYPFMSGIDTHRVMFLMQIFIITGIFSSFFSIIDKHTNLLKVKNKNKILIISESNNIKKRVSEVKEVVKNQDYEISIQDFDTFEAISIESSLSKWDLIVYDTGIKNADIITSILLENQIKGKKIVDFPTFYSHITGRIPLELIDDVWLLSKRNSFFNNLYLLRIIRVVDFFFALALLIILMIPCLLIALILKYESVSSPILFTQERLGKNMKPFTIYKFRSMISDAEKNGPQWASKNDNRVTPVGSFLRKTHMDELPQVFNLLTGHISLIGPRPIRLHFAEQLMQHIPYYALRFLVKPGITGWAQVYGPYGANIEEQRIKQEMDIYYIQNASTKMRLRLLFGTGKKIVDVIKYSK